MKHYVVYRDRPGKRGPVRKYLRRPWNTDGRWTWSKDRIGAAWFADLTQADAYAAAYEGAQSMLIER